MRHSIACNAWTKLLTLALFGLIGLAGCAEQPQPLSDAQIHAAQPVTGWPGFNNISRDGKFYFAGQPSEAALRQATERGIKVVVNLRTDAEMADRDKVAFDEVAALRDMGVSYVSIPVLPTTFGASDAKKLDEVLRNTTGPVLLHCSSSNRVGALWGLYLHQIRGVALPEAIELAHSAGLTKPEDLELLKRTAAASTERTKQ